MNNNNTTVYIIEQENNVSPTQNKINFFDKKLTGTYLT